MFTVMLVLGLALAAPAVNAPSFQPCSLVSRDDAASALGLAITELQSNPAADGATCSYKTGRAGRSVLLTVMRKTSRDEASVTFEQDIIANERFYVQPPVSLAELGDAARAFGHVLWVRRANVIFVINVIDARVEGATLERAKVLARKAIARIDAQPRSAP